MRTIIAGSREGVTYEDVLEAVASADWTPSVVISGTARGADKLGERWATENSIPIERFAADWDRFGKSAGYIRNAEMAKSAEALIALWNFRSKGTKHMLDLAEKEDLYILVFEID